MQYHILWTQSCAKDEQVSLYTTPWKFMHPPFSIQSGHSLDLWPWKPFQQCPLRWWIFVPSFIEIPPLSRQKLWHRKSMLMDNRYVNYTKISECCKTKQAQPVQSKADLIYLPRSPWTRCSYKSFASRRNCSACSAIFSLAKLDVIMNTASLHSTVLPLPSVSRPW